MGLQVVVECVAHGDHPGGSLPLARSLLVADGVFTVGHQAADRLRLGPGLLVAEVVGRADAVGPWFPASTRLVDHVEGPVAGTRDHQPEALRSSRVGRPVPRSAIGRRFDRMDVSVSKDGLIRRATPRHRDNGRRVALSNQYGSTAVRPDLLSRPIPMHPKVSHLEAHKWLMM
jgi:hypothetical protein